jgi:DNA polymerase-1
MMLLEIDINQAELRVLGDLSKDQTLYQIYTIPNHPSIHDVTRIDMFGDPKQYSQSDWSKWMERFSISDYTDQKRCIHEQKMRAKAINFGIVYGRGASSVAEDFEVPVPEAQEWITKWFRKYEGAGKFINRCRSAPLKGENLVTPFGFKRRFQLVAPEKLNDMQNQAANFPEQSIAWHLTLHTGLLIQDIARYDYDAYIVNTVYDSILFELPDNGAALELGARALNILSEVPRRIGLTHIPFRGDIKIGRSWGHLEEVELPASVQMNTRRKWPLGVPESMYLKYQKFLPTLPSF